MNRKTLIVLGGAALFVDHSRTPQSNVAEKAGMLAPGLRDHVNEVTKITFTSAGNQPAVTLVRGERGWTVSQRGGYPADLGKLREYLLRFADAILLEQKTANKDRYPDLGVEDITAADAKGVLVDLDGLPAPLRVIVGTFDGQGGNGTFVRRADEAQSWLAKGTLTPDKDPAAWLAKDLPGIAAERVARVEIRHADGRSVRVERKAPGDTQLVIADIPKGRQPSSGYVANGLGSVLPSCARRRRRRPKCRHRSRPCRHATRRSTASSSTCRRGRSASARMRRSRPGWMPRLPPATSTRRRRTPQRSTPRRSPARRSRPTRKRAHPPMPGRPRLHSRCAIRRPTAADGWRHSRPKWRN